MDVGLESKIDGGMGLGTGSVVETGEGRGESKGQGATLGRECDAVCGKKKEKDGEGKPGEELESGWRRGMESAGVCAMQASEVWWWLVGGRDEVMGMTGE